MQIIILFEEILNVYIWKSRDRWRFEFCVYLQIFRFIRWFIFSGQRKCLKLDFLNTLSLTQKTYFFIPAKKYSLLKVVLQDKKTKQKTIRFWIFFSTKENHDFFHESHFDSFRLISTHFCSVFGSVFGSNDDYRCRNDENDN